MNESGVLGKFVPEFGKIVALMQFNMYHHYTVDEHLIRAVGVMAEIANGGLRDQLPLTHELLPSLNDTRLLYVALFLHDIAKGRPEDHSIAGARIARKFCPRLGLDEAETDTVAWLIEYHLLMSEIAQSRDLQDPETARAFADIVQSPQRLALLMILTACDIRAVGPGVWTGWKGSLLRSLYYATEPLLSGGHSRVTQADRIAAAKADLENALAAWPKPELETYMARHYNHYWLRAELELQLEHARMIRAADAAHNPFAGAIRVQAFEGITEVSFYTPDHPRLLSLIAGACTMAEASIIGAQIFSTRDGRAARYLPPAPRLYARTKTRRFAPPASSIPSSSCSPASARSSSIWARTAATTGALSPSRFRPKCRSPTRLSEKFTVIEVIGPRPHGPPAPADPRHLRSQPHHRLGPHRHLWRKGRGRLLRHRSHRPQNRIQDPPEDPSTTLLNVFEPHTPHAEQRAPKVANG